jgi:hypothetical protein
MRDSLKSTFKIGWVFTATAFLILPMIVPSHPYNRDIAIAIEGSTFAMFLLSFPSSVIAVPILFLNTIALGLEGSLAGNYMMTVLLAITGYLQWFWIVPKLFFEGACLQRLNLRESVGNRRLFERAPETYADWCGVAGTTPLEHVISDAEKSYSS